MFDINIKQDNPTDKVEAYKSALSLLFYEGQIAWQMNILFIALNVGLGALIQNLLIDIGGHRTFFILISLIGISINIGWWGTFNRNNRYYHFRMAQSREAEPKDWQLLRIRGYDFSKGMEILIEDKTIQFKDYSHQLTKLEKCASNKIAISLVIWIFIIGFILLLALALFPEFINCFALAGNCTHKSS